MPEKICPHCQEPFDANSIETECCRKAKCVKANQRKKKREAAGITEVKRGRPKSHVVLLKERTIERIRGKAQGPSSTPSASSDLPVPDVPPAVAALAGWKVKILHNPVSYQDDVPYRGPITFLPTTDATAGLPPEALPATNLSDLAHQSAADSLGIPVESVKMVGPLGVVSHFQVEKSLNSKRPPVTGFTQLPIQHHGTENDLARSIISKVPAVKLDPNSEEAELSRLQKSQLRTAKKKD